jgi:hypothetical protein
MQFRSRHVAALAGALGLILPLSSAVAAQTASAAPTSGAAVAWNKGHKPVCTITAKPGRFIETGLGNSTSSVAFVLEVECRPVYSETNVEIYAAQLNNACHNTLLWYSPTGKRGEPRTGKGEYFNVFLDDDGNATAVVWGGPSCAASEDLITADLTGPPYTTAKTHVTIQAPRTTAVALHAYPAREVEDSIGSYVMAIFYAEFPGSYAEQRVEFSNAQLFDRCHGSIYWVGPDGRILGHNQKSVKTTLDDNGNAWVVALAGPSCAAGETTAQADIVGANYRTITTNFRILTPRVTD